MRIPEDLHKKAKDNNLCLTDIMIEALEEKIAKIEAGEENTPITPDQRVDAALEKLDGDHDLAQYLSTSGRVHRKVVAYAYARVEWDTGLILNARQKERVRDFLSDQFLEVRDEIESRPPPLDEITGKRLNNFSINTGYRTRLQVEGKTPELLREIGERFILNSGPVTPTSLESIIEHLRSKY